MKYRKTKIRNYCALLYISNVNSILSVLRLNCHKVSEETLKGLLINLLILHACCSNRHNKTIILKISAGSLTFIVSALVLPEPAAASVSLSQRCHSDAHLSQMSNSYAELVKVDYKDLSAGTDPVTPGFPSCAQGGQQPRDAPLDRGSASVKSDKENETEKGRSVALQLRRDNGTLLKTK